MLKKISFAKTSLAFSAAIIIFLLAQAVVTLIIGTSISIHTYYRYIIASGRILIGINIIGIILSAISVVKEMEERENAVIGTVINVISLAFVTLAMASYVHLFLSVSGMIFEIKDFFVELPNLTQKTGKLK